MEALLSPLSSRPKRTRISCHATLDRAACAPFRKEGRMKCTNAIKFHRKSGGAQWRDLQCARRRSRILRLKPQTTNRSVIPNGAKRSGATCCSSSEASNVNESATLPFVIPTRISCHAALDKAACAPFCKGKAHEVYQRHQFLQEIRGSEAEGSAVRPSVLSNSQGPPHHGINRMVCLVTASTAAWLKGMANVLPLYQ
jgi:hypothetical protein